MNQISILSLPLHTWYCSRTGTLWWDGRASVAKSIWAVLVSDMEILLFQLFNMYVFQINVNISRQLYFTHFHIQPERIGLLPSAARFATSSTDFGVPKLIGSILPVTFIDVLFADKWFGVSCSSVEKASFTDRWLFSKSSVAFVRTRRISSWMFHDPAER